MEDRQVERKRDGLQADSGHDAVVPQARSRVPGPWPVARACRKDSDSGMSLAWAP